MRVLLQGVDNQDALFDVNGTGVVVNTRTLAASVVPLEAEAMSRFWVAPQSDAPVSTWGEVASCAISSFSGDVSVTATGTVNRAYTIPKNVSRAAAGALERRRFGAKGGTAVSCKIGTLLAAGGQVTLRDISYIRRFFAANVDQRGSLAWNLWGGDSGSRWSQATINKVGITAAADSDVEVNLLAFYDGDETTRTFLAQKTSDDLRDDEVNALFRRTPEASWQTWLNGDWVDVPSSDVVKDRLVELDDDAAVYVAGALFDAPDAPVPLRNFEPEEWDIAASALSGVDWELVDRTIRKKQFGSLTAAGPNDESPGEYSPEERSKNASKQLRDKNGRFAKVGDQGLMKSGLRGEIATLNPSGNEIVVKAEDGNSYMVDPGDFEIDGGAGTTPSPATAPVDPNAPELPPLNMDKILGQPRATKTTPKAWLKTHLQPMGPKQIKDVIADYGKFINDERQSRAADFKGGTAWRESKPFGKKTSEERRRLKRDLRRYADTSDEVPPVEKLTPTTSDVKPLYLAIVDRDDPQAVTDLVAMIPSTDASDETTAFRRVGGDWVEDTKLMQDMRSPTPPPVVQLDDAMYQDVLQQVDSNPVEDPNAPPPTSDQAPSEAPVPAPATASAHEPGVIPLWGPNQQMLMLITAAGGADRNRGNAERLRRYWLYGPGAAKIRWNTPGDWTRCVRLLSKHMGSRAKGYCALRHKEATGMWTGDKRHRKGFSFFPGERIFDSTEEIVSTEEVLTASIERAKVRELKARVYGNEYAGAENPESIDPSGGGRRFRVPLLIPEGLESGDGRTFDVGSLSLRSLPLPLLWQTKTGEGHDGSVLVGRIDHVERTEDGLGNATGVFDTGPWGQEAQRLVENKMLRWVSVDLDRFEAEEMPDESELADKDSPAESDGIKQPKVRIKKGRLMGATLVAKPAYQEVTIELEPLGEMVRVEDGMYASDSAEPITASAGIAESIPVEPPKTWFDRPVLNGPTPITVTDEGQVFGHIATWDVSHIGLPNATRAPRSASGYAYFHTGVIRCAEGDDVRVGQLTLAGGHADMLADAVTAVKHYDDTGSAICDVHAGEDSYGIWVAGALRPGTTPEQVRALRASSPSGDWRNINGRLELVAVCQVNVPGFPVVRSQLTAGAVVSLVAAGAQTLASLRTDSVEDLSTRVARLEAWERGEEQRRAQAAVAKVREIHPKPDLDSLAASARARVYNVLDVDGYLSEFKDFSPQKRDELAKKGAALKDGSFPIENVADLRRAIRAYGRTSDDKKAKVRRHIVKRARALDKSDLIPKNWNEAGITDDALRARDARETLTAAALERRAEQIRKRVK